MPPKKNKTSAAPPPPARVKRGRPPAVAAVENPTPEKAKAGKTVKDADTSTPDTTSKRRGRPSIKENDEMAAAEQLIGELSNAVENMDDNEAEAPKKRGRGAKKMEEVVEEVKTEAPKRRGRPAKATAATEETPTDAKEASTQKKGRGKAAVEAEEEPAEAAPKRRGRPAKVAVQEEEPAADVAPKRRGRPAAAKAPEEATVEAPKRRGRPPAAKTQDPETDELASEPPKRQGRGPAKAKEETVEQPAGTATKRRGRPPKAKLTAEPASTTTKGPSANSGKKRGRPAADNAPDAAPAAKKQRGRPPAAAAAAAADNDDDDAESGSTPPAEKPRGRPKGALNKPKTQISKVTAKAPEKTSRAAPAKRAEKKAAAPTKDDAEDDGQHYWLMKAEPDSRVENGYDVKFSIDDLMVAKAPEPWDGVRNYVARNNMMAMKQGDLAFFYHSNCKVPGIAGIMEIAQEQSVDESAFNENHPYFDAKSSRDNPKWFLVHVAFKHKFPELVSLETLKSHAQPGGPLENMQLVKQSRLSVSKVSKAEWDFIMSLADSDATYDAGAAKSAVENDDKMDIDVEQPATENDAGAGAEPSFEEELHTASVNDKLATAAVDTSASSPLTTPPPADTEAEAPATNGDTALLNGHLAPSSQSAPRAQSAQPPSSSLRAPSSRPASRGLSVPPTATKRGSRPSSRAGSRAPSVGPQSRRSVSREPANVVVQAEIMAEVNVEVQGGNGNGNEMMQVMEQQEEELERMFPE